LQVTRAQFAASHGDTGWHAHAFPLSVDGVEIVASLVLLADPGSLDPILSGDDPIRIRSPEGTRHSIRYSAERRGRQHNGPAQRVAARQAQGPARTAPKLNA
jgi:hypothetical protein